MVYNACSDPVFKKIFGVEENKDLLIAFVNSVLDQKDQVKEIQLVNPYNDKNSRDSRTSILDIKAKSIDGRMLNIEVQVRYESNYNKRALYYWASLYAEQRLPSRKQCDENLRTNENSEVQQNIALPRSYKEYSEFVKTILIHILGFNAISENKQYHNSFHIAGKNNHSSYFNNLLELHVIELKKFAPNPNEDFSSLMAKVGNSLDLWTAFLAENELFEEHKKEIKDSNIQRAMEIVREMNFTKEEKELYEAYLKNNSIDNTGLQEARWEAIKNIAKKMLKKGISISDIIEVTELTTEEIEKLND